MPLFPLKSTIRKPSAAVQREGTDAPRASEGEGEGVVGNTELASVLGFDPPAPEDSDRQKDNPGWPKPVVFQEQLEIQVIR